MIDAVSALSVTDPAMAQGGTLPALAARMGATASVDQAAQEFEAMFATQLLQPMFATVKVGETFGGGHGEEVMRSFMVQEYGKVIAKTGMLGIAAQVKTEMLRAQEAARARGASTAQQISTAYAAPSSASFQKESAYVAH